MKMKNTKILKVSAVASILSIGLLSGAYSILEKDMTLVVRGEEKSISTFKSNVKEVLEEQKVKYDSNDIINADLNDKVKDGMSVEVIDVKEETIKESKEVPFEVEIVDDANLDKGSTIVDKEGTVGKNELIYTLTYHNNKVVDKKFVKEVVSVEPENKIVKKGTKVEVKVASSRGETSRGNINKVSVNKASTNTNTSTSTNTNANTNSNTNGKYMKVVATAYTGDSVTSTGSKPRWGTIAVDPSVIPYGTKVYIPQFDMTFIAEDTGSAIKGNKIDIFMNNEGDVYNWGRKTIDIYIVG